jgi:hypothetical protein
MAGYLNSSIFGDEKGTITTTANPQVFKMVDVNKPRKYDVIQLRITADSTNDVKIKLNDENSIIYILAGETYDFDGKDIDLVISSITCVSAIGTKFSFEAGATKTNYYIGG